MKAKTVKFLEENTEEISVRLNLTIFISDVHTMIKYGYWHLRTWNSGKGENTVYR